MKKQEQNLRNLKWAIGAKQTYRAILAHRADEVLLAADADEEMTAPIRELCEKTGVPFQTVSSASELGVRCGIRVRAAAAAALKQE